MISIIIICMTEKLRDQDILSWMQGFSHTCLHVCIHVHARVMKSEINEKDNETV